MSVAMQNRRRIFRQLLSVIACVLVLNACATRPPPGYYNGGYQSAPVGNLPNGPDNELYTGNGIAVLGVVAVPYDLRQFRQNNLAVMLETQIRTLSPVSGSLSDVVPYNEIRKKLSSKGEHQVLLKRFKHNGKLTSEDMRFLKSAAIPARYIVIARIDRNDTTRYRPVKSAIKNHYGDALSDKQKITLLHQRTVQISARAYDIESGSETWSGSFISQPINRYSYTEYTGSSITGAMATRFANSFINGRSGKKYPPAPRASDSIREAFKSIAKAIGGNTYARL